MELARSGRGEMAVIQLAGTRSELADLLEASSEAEVEAHDLDLLLYEVDQKHFEIGKKVIGTLRVGE